MSKHSATATTGADTTNLIPFKQPTGGGKCYARLHQLRGPGIPGSAGQTHPPPFTQTAWPLGLSGKEPTLYLELRAC